MKLRDLFPWGRKATSSLDIFREIYGGRMPKTGRAIKLDDALRCATVLACARVRATGIAQVPLKLFQEDEITEKKTPAKNHPLYYVLHRRPNPWQTSYELRETIGLHLALTGRAYVFKTIVAGRIRELIPLEPNKTRAKLGDDGVTITYEVTGKDGQVREFASGLIWHIKEMSWSGWEAMDAMDLAREAVGLAVATEESQAAMHKNGVRVPGVYTVEGTLNQEQYKQLRKFIQENYAGDNAGVPMVLDRAAKWVPLAMTGVDAQHLETRKHQIAEICRAMGVMPIMVFESDKAATYASAEAMFDAHIKYTLAPMWERLEQSIDCHLLSEEDLNAGIFAKFIGNAMARGSMKDRGEFYAKALGAGGSPAWMSPDEVRRLEELNPMGGDAAKLPAPSNVPKPPPADPLPAT